MKKSFNATKAVGQFTISVIFLAFFYGQNCWALTVQKANIVGDVVKIKGSDAVPHADIFWEVGFAFPPEAAVAQADEKGDFKFSSDKLPRTPTCIGSLRDGLDRIDVEVGNCRGGIDGFYTASQDRTLLAPGQFGGVRSFCDLGDFAVSGQLVIRAGGGYSEDERDFKIISFGLVIDGLTEQQSWVLEGSNVGNDPVDIRVAARCARVLPPQMHHDDHRDDDKRHHGEHNEKIYHYKHHYKHPDDDRDEGREKR